MGFSKSIVCVVGFILAIIVSGVTSASPHDLGLLGPGSELGETMTKEFSDETPDKWTFTLTQQSDVAIVLSPTSGINGELSDHKGNILESGTDFVVGLQTGILYTLFVQKDGKRGQLGYSGTISAVPLPAAAWLFGSAIMGLTLVARRRKTTNSLLQA